MAWGVKYRGSFYNIAGRNIQVDISEQDYVGTIYNLRIQRLEISQEWNEYQTALTGAGLEMSIVNEDYAWDFYEELLVCEEQEYKITATIKSDHLFPTDYVIFEGFLITDIQEQQVLQWATINLKASNYLGRLEMIDEMACINGAAVWPLIQYIGEALQATGLLYNIYVNCSLYETQMDNGRLMSELLIHKHLFYEGEEEDAELKYNGLSEIINTILKPFGMYVYSFNQRWYIERYADLEDIDSNFEYNITYYDVYDISTLAYVETVDYAEPVLIKYTDGDTRWGTFQYVDTSQTMEYGKGYRKVTVNCRLHKEHNLVNEYFGDAIPFDSVKADVLLPTTDVERWGYDSVGTLDYGEDWVCLKIPNVSVKNWKYRGITQRVLLRGTQRGEVTLNISFRRQMTEFEKFHIVDYSGQFLQAYEEIKIISRIAIFFADPSYNSTWYHPHDYYYLYKNSDDRWEMRAYNRFTMRSATDIEIIAGEDENGYTPHLYWRYDAEGDYYYWPFEFSITLNNSVLPQHLFNINEFDFDLFKDDTIAEIHFNTGGFRWNVRDDWHGQWDYGTNFPVEKPVYRKIRVTTSDEEDDRDVEVEGEISTTYLDELVVDIDLYDHTNHAAANVMYINDAFLPAPGQLTPPLFSEEWLDSRTELESDRHLTLQEHLLEDLFQFYNKPRKKLKARIRYDYPIRPFSLLYDHNITRDGSPILLLVLAYTLDVNEMIYEIEAEEYVVDDNFRLIDGEIVQVYEGSSSSMASDSWDSAEEESSGTTYQEITTADFSKTITLPLGEQMYFEYGYAQYYHSGTGLYREVLVMDYYAPMSPQLIVRPTVSMPRQGSPLQDYFVIQSGYTTDTLPVSTFYSGDPQESLTAFYITAGAYVLKLSAFQEFTTGTTDYPYQFSELYTYKALFEAVTAVGELNE